jgi:cysteine desulfurase
MVYLDNAATTALRPEVIEAMTAVMHQYYGNPSATHSFGRSSRGIVESARKSIAQCIHAHAQEIIFTSGGTEANNWVISNAVFQLKVQRIITSKMEHHAVLYPIQNVADRVEVVYLPNDKNGVLDLTVLEHTLADQKLTLVSLMHVNNETGVVNDIEAIANICKASHAYFHTDTVQSIGKIPMNLQQIPIDFLVASAHKFHGPKGVGFAFIRKGISIGPFLLGGAQEKGWRAGTEGLHQISGMEKALAVAVANLSYEQQYIEGLKQYAIDALYAAFPKMHINGGQTQSIYNILNVRLPLDSSKTGMILFNLDMKGIAVSRGSACQSGSIKPSHVLAEILDAVDLTQPSLRISFSHNNTTRDIDLLISALKTL